MEECGADGHVKKPFDSQELVRLVEEMMGGTVDEERAFELHTVEDSADGDDQVEVREEAGISGFGAVVTEFPAGEADASSFDVDITGAGKGVEVESTEGAFAEIVEPETEVQVDMEGHQAQALSDDDVDRIASRLVELLGDEVVREIAWDVVPDLAEIVIKERLRELESQVD